MDVVTWQADGVSSTDSVAAAGSMSGAQLRDGYQEAIRKMTLGLARYNDGVLVIGPWKLLRLGKPTITRTSVDWPIEGGLLAERGGHWRIQARGGRVEATMTGLRPRLPRAVYAVSHLQVHLLFTRLFLLRLHGREPLPGTPAPRPDRVSAATVDAAMCLALARFAGGRRLKSILAIAAIYHVACWTVSGRTLGGAVMRQRVVAVDGSPLTPQQSMLRLVLLPLAWVTWRPLHDRIAGTEVIID
jgi:hypothetical protein